MHTVPDVTPRGGSRGGGGPGPFRGTPKLHKEGKNESVKLKGSIYINIYHSKKKVGSVIFKMEIFIGFDKKKKNDLTQYRILGIMSACDASITQFFPSTRGLPLIMHAPRGRGPVKPAIHFHFVLHAKRGGGGPGGM